MKDSGDGFGFAVDLIVSGFPNHPLEGVNSIDLLESNFGSLVCPKGIGDSKVIAHLILRLVER
jgi:hypothetical protein